MSFPVQGPEDLEIYVGDDFSYPVAFWLDSAMTEPDTTVADCEYTAQIRKTAKAPAATASFTCTITAANEVTLSLSDTATIDLKPGNYVTDLQEDNSGVITTPLFWNVVVRQDVTRLD